LLFAFCFGGLREEGLMYGWTLLPLRLLLLLQAPLLMALLLLLRLQLLLLLRCLRPLCALVTAAAVTTLG
jgi:hypothetical protein